MLIECYDPSDGKWKAPHITNGAAHTIDGVWQVPSTPVTPQIGGVDAKEARLTWGDPSTPLSHCRLYINAADKATAAAALETNGALVSNVLPGVIAIKPGIKIFTVALVGVFRTATVDGTDPAPMANGAGTRVFGCIPDSLDYGGGGTEVADRTIFWDFTANASNGVDVAFLTIPPAEYNVDATATDSPPVVTVSCVGGTV